MANKIIFRVDIHDNKSRYKPGIQYSLTDALYKRYYPFADTFAMEDGKLTVSNIYAVCDDYHPRGFDASDNKIIKYDGRKASTLSITAAQVGL